MLIISFFNIIGEKKSQTYIVIIDPMGDAQKTGRMIFDTFERGLTLQCAEKIKNIIEQTANSFCIIITRLPGDTVYELQNASLANRNSHLFISLNFYATHDTKPTLTLYHFSYGDNFSHYQSTLSFYPYDQAYKVNQEQTKQIAALFKKNLTQAQSLFTVDGPYALPVKQLIGIVTPSLVIEAGLKDKNFLHKYAEIIAQTIITTLNEIRIDHV